MRPTIPTPDELKTMLLERMNFSEREQQAFLFPAYELGDPFAFSDMQCAVERIKRAVDAGEHIGIYADYDCDGIPAAVILLDLFKQLKVADRVHVYIPDRHDEGYGLSTQGIEALERQGVTLMITVDVGITALAEVADAQGRGIDCIVTDHHAALSMLPAGHAVVHPANGTANPDLCGSGVAFALVRGFLQTYGDTFGITPGWEKWLLDLVGFATLSDMVPLVGENRVLASYGLMVMRKTRRIGLRVLFAANMIDPLKLTEQDLTFTVAPRLNAASRMATPMLAFELLSTDDPARAKEIVAELTLINDERKKLVARIVKDAHKRLEARELPEIVVIGDLTWRPAVLGLVANKLQETYSRSFLVWGEAGDGTLKGSCRMIETHHAAELFQSLPENAVIHAGGHKAAGGFAVTREQVLTLETSLNDAIAQSREHASVDIEASEVQASEPLTLPLGAVTTRHQQMVRQFAPFGVGNPEPLFYFEQVTVRSTKKFGKAKEHFECAITDETGSATAFMFFADPSIMEEISVGSVVSFVGTLEAGWRGGVRLRIKAFQK